MDRLHRFIPSKEPAAQAHDRAAYFAWLRSNPLTATGTYIVTYKNTLVSSAVSARNAVRIVCLKIAQGYQFKYLKVKPL